MTRLFTPRLLAFLLLAVIISCKKSDSNPDTNPPTFCRSVSITGQGASALVVNFDDKDRIIAIGEEYKGEYRDFKSFSYSPKGILNCPDPLACGYINDELRSMKWPLDYGESVYNSQRQLVKGTVGNVDIGYVCSYVYDSEGDPTTINVQYINYFSQGRTSTINVEYSSYPNPFPEKQPEFAYVEFLYYPFFFDGVPIPSKHLIKKWTRTVKDWKGTVTTDTRNFTYKYDGEGRVIEARNSASPDYPVTFKYGKCQ